MFKFGIEGKMYRFNRLVSLIEECPCKEDAYSYYRKLSKLYDILVKSSLSMEEKQVLCSRLSRLASMISKKNVSKKNTLNLNIFC